MILSTDNAVQFVEKVNLAFSTAGLATRLNDSMNSEQVITVLNSAFESLVGKVVLTSLMNAAQFIEAVNTNLALLNVQDKTVLKFLHISDIHNSSNADAITECKSLMDNDSSLEFTFLTGDYTGYNGSYANLTTAMQNLGSKLLMLNGNHDVYDGFSNNQPRATQFLKSVVTNQDVVWGDSQGVASYYYRDIRLSDISKLRIISVDAYDYRAGIGSRYDTVYSQDQIDWIVARMLELESTDYFFIAMHEPPVNASTTNYSYNVSGKMDDDIVALRRSNPFCSARLWVWDTSLSNGNLLPIIINAYMNKGHLAQVIGNKNSDTGEFVSFVNLSYDFESIEPATFLFYLGGHLHGDFAEYHPTYQQQLILLVDCGNSSTLGNSSDIGTRTYDTGNGTRSNGKLINEIELDFVNSYINITRIGQNAAGSFNGFPSLVRNSISFPFKKN